ncbi:MAG: DUF4199 domain-containing protein [Chitinophagia bacterium]|nr:DUF4199 domain-containing protein [Chitinophagia bacterium]
MEQKLTPPWMIALITSLICIVMNIVAYAMNQLTNKSLGYIQMILQFGIIIWACIHYAKQKEGQVTFGNVFAHGFKVTAGIAAIISIYTFISVKLIYPEIIEMTIDAARAEMEKKGQVPADQIDMALGFTRKFFLPFAIAGSLFSIALIGVVASLIGAGVAKKNPISPFENAS